MKGRLAGMTLCFMAAFIVLTLVLTRVGSTSDPDSGGLKAVALSEIEQLVKQGDTEAALREADKLREQLMQEEAPAANNTAAVPLCAAGCFFAAAVFCYVYFSVLRPFDKLRSFAARIARGELDVPLEYERSNWFGSFTWAFDSMRREITAARACEREAIDNNKTVIATLSHDIKTPVSSIRAYAEGLDANLDTSPERRRKYLSVIMRKCDEVSRLTNDLFLHSLSDLDRLAVHPERFELMSFMEGAVEELSAGQGDVTFIRNDPEAYISADKNRLMQMTENLINNARKYARTDVTVTASKEDGCAVLRFTDKGNGIPDGDMPFIFGKFYRGHNCGSEPGSGLGLYIVRYLTEAQGGEVKLRNIAPHGLEVTVSLPLTSPDP